MDSYNVATVVILGLSLLLNVISVSAPYWSTRGDVAYSGLWKACSTAYGATVCISTTGVHADWMDATRAMMLLSMLCVAAAILVAILCLVKNSFGSKHFLIVLISTSVASALFVLVAVIVYGAKTTKPGAILSLGWAYWLAVVHVGLSAAGGLLVLFHCRRQTPYMPL